MRKLAALLVLVLGVALQPGWVAAQQSAPQSAIAILDQEALFERTAYGRAIQAKIQAEADALLGENRKIDAALEAEERDLTDRRNKMTPETFRPLADAFDVKANELRKAQDAKSRDLARSRDQMRQDFFQNIGPIIGEKMIERGAAVVVEKSSVIVSLEAIDITAAVTKEIDAQFGDGSKQLQP